MDIELDDAHVDAPPEKFSKFDSDRASGDCSSQPQATTNIECSSQRRVKAEPTERISDSQRVQVFADSGCGASIKKDPSEGESPLTHQY